MTLDSGRKISRSSTTGLRTRLVAITIVPMLGIVTWAGGSTSARYRQARKAARVAEGVNRLGRLLEARVVLDAERLPTQSKIAIQRFGVPVTFASMVLGFNPDARIAEVRPATDAAFQGELARFRDDLKRLRKQVDAEAGEAVSNKSLGAQGGEFKSALDLFRSIDRELDRRSLVESRAIEVSLRGLDSERELWRSVEALLGAQSVVNELGSQATLVFDVQSGEGESRLARRKLAASESAGEMNLQVLQANAGPDTSPLVAEFLRDPATVKSSTIVRDTLLTPTKPFMDAVSSLSAMQSLADRFIVLLRRTEMGRGLLASSLDETKRLAVSAEKSAKNQLLLTVGLAAGLALISVLIALSFARSISRPLRVLARRADLIGSGQLDGDPLEERGPREVVQVNRAVNELVDNLTILDRQASALALGSLQDPVLDEALPGALGQSMQNTIDRLRSSIENREELQLLLSHQATHDDLTGLPNRKSLMDAFQGVLGRSSRNATGVAVLFIDLDGFKRANDTHGHRFGDQVLVVCAQRVAAALRSGDFVARIGGDEFVVVLENVANVGEVVSIANRYISTLSVPVTIDEKTTNIGASIGIAVDFEGTATGATLLRDADIAVYRAKATGRGHAEVFDEDLREEMRRQSDVERAIVEAIQNKELRLEYQPLVQVTKLPDGSTKTTVSSVEALVRWERVGHGLIPPSEFIPLLETSPRIVDLGVWVLQEAMTEAARWKASVGELPVAINVSTRHLVAPTFVDDVRAALVLSEIDPARVTLEITETSLVDNVAIAITHLEAVRELGVRIALDDFGTGFTSIRQLTDFPVDILKIDKSFIDRITDTANSSERSIVEMIIGVGRALGLEMVAEGVERSEQAEMLSTIGCGTHQGFFYHRPLRPEQFLRQVEELARLDAGNAERTSHQLV
jgi:diguanylate cyclase (GGDEF)-like protein